MAFVGGSAAACAISACAVLANGVIAACAAANAADAAPSAGSFGGIGGVGGSGQACRRSSPLEGRSTPIEAEPDSCGVAGCEGDVEG